MTNAERQRKFQKAHPGYDARRKKTSRASAKRGALLLLKAMKAKFAAEVEAQTLTPAKPFLMLPAPVVDPLMAEINALAEKLARARAAEANPPLISNRAA